MQTREKRVKSRKKEGEMIENGPKKELTYLSGGLDM
jgi:hypothetical protein